MKRSDYGLLFEHWLKGQYIIGRRKWLKTANWLITWSSAHKTHDWRGNDRNESTTAIVGCNQMSAMTITLYPYPLMTCNVKIERWRKSTAVFRPDLILAVSAKRCKREAVKCRNETPSVKFAHRKSSCKFRINTIPDNFIDHVATVIDIRRLFFAVSSNSRTSRQARVYFEIQLN